MLEQGDKVVWHTPKRGLLFGTVGKVDKERNMSKIHFDEKAKSYVRNDKLKKITKIFEYLYVGT